MKARIQCLGPVLLITPLLFGVCAVGAAPAGIIARISLGRHIGLLLCPTMAGDPFHVALAFLRFGASLRDSHI